VICLVLAFARALALTIGPRHAEYTFVVAALIAHTVNMFCIANQMAPYLPCFVTLVLFAKLAFVEDPASKMPAELAVNGYERNGVCSQQPSQPLGNDHENSPLP
jgi:hypothetical protein